MKKFISLFLVFSILLLSGNLYAKERKGADIEIYKTKPKTEMKMEGTPWEWTKLKGASPDLRGELIAVKENSILLLDKESGADVTLDIEDISVIRILKKSNLLKGAGWGALSGAVIASGVAIAAKIDYKYKWDEEQWTFALLSIAFTAGLGLLIGGLFGWSSGIDKTIQIEGKSDSEIQNILEKLRKKARIRNSR